MQGGVRRESRMDKGLVYTTQRGVVSTANTEVVIARLVWAPLYGNYRLLTSSLTQREAPPTCSNLVCK